MSKPKAFLGINPETMKCSMVSEYSEDGLAECAESGLIALPCTIDAAQKHFGDVLSADQIADAARGAFL